MYPYSNGATRSMFRRGGAFIVLMALSGLSACSDLVNGAKLPSSLMNPSAVHSEAGAIGAYQKTLADFADAVSGWNRGSFVLVGGLLSDELTVPPRVGFPGSDNDRIDSRTIASDPLSPYALLHRVRGDAQEGRGLLREYAPNLSPALRGHLFAMEGMADMLLADLFCSGIPLSTVDFNANYTLTRGFTTQEVYQAALAFFDSADKYMGDSLRLKAFVQLGRGRTLLALGQIEAAKDAVQGIATEYQYTNPYSMLRKKFVPAMSPRDLMVSTLEGGNGLPFGDGHDPRTTLPALADSTSSLVFSSGVEARLIEAEAALAAGQSGWLTILNRLRTTCTTIESCPDPAPAGDGGIAGLPPLLDPANGAAYTDATAKEARVRLVFEERGYWLFLTGHRQGDLRRLVRNYGYRQQTVYPTGAWGFVSTYGREVTMPTPADERKNGLYEGCFNREA